MRAKRYLLESKRNRCQRKKGNYHILLVMHSELVFFIVLLEGVFHLFCAGSYKQSKISVYRKLIKTLANTSVNVYFLSFNPHAM